MEAPNGTNGRDDTSPSPLRRLDENLWVVDYPLRVAGLAIGTRMTVIRLRDGSLFLHSPTPLVPALRDALDALGTVRFAVAPSKVHHLFIGEYRDAWPDCQLYAAPGLPAKRKDVRFDAELGDEVPDGWRGQIEQVCFRGAAYINEVEFLHPPTRTLVMTDLAFNVQHIDSLWTRLFFSAVGVYGKFGPSRMVRLTIRDRTAARESLERILRWDFDRVIVAHGIVLQRSGKRLLRAAYEWLD